MKEAYCSHEIVKLLEEKGFPKDNFTHYEYDPKGVTAYKTCTHQMAMKWLREVHHICIVVYPFTHRERGTYTSDICTTEMTMEEGHLRGVWDTYESATEASLEYVLENMI